MLQSLKAADRPLSIEEILEEAKKILPRIGKRTVYRNVRELVLAGELVGIDYAGQPTRYEQVTGKNRPHFICRRCERAFYLDEEARIPDLETKATFRIEWAEVILYGVCRRTDCRNRAPLSLPES